MIGTKSQNSKSQYLSDIIDRDQFIINKPISKKEQENGGNERPNIHVDPMAELNKKIMLELKQ